VVSLIAVMVSICTLSKRSLDPCCLPEAVPDHFSQTLVALLGKAAIDFTEQASLIAAQSGIRFGRFVAAPDHRVVAVGSISRQSMPVRLSADNRRNAELLVDIAAAQIAVAQRS